MIQKILIQQEKLIPEYQNKWLNIGLSSFLDYKNTDIISNLYTLIGLNKPNYIFFS
ncbi:hypothetical protein NSMS1_48520 [Nostoc sp. MS1]|nr:hypothetical protein NSMS1_48520 [Nostoc sp. MS1]